MNRILGVEAKAAAEERRPRSIQTTGPFGQMPVGVQSAQDVLQSEFQVVFPEIREWGADFAHVVIKRVPHEQNLLSCCRSRTHGSDSEIDTKHLN